MEHESPALYAAAGDYWPEAAFVNVEAISALVRPDVIDEPVVGINVPELAERPALFCAYLLAMNSLNYQFWSPAERTEFQSTTSALPLTRYTKDGLVGALAMENSFSQWWMRHCNLELDDSSCLHTTIEGMRKELDFDTAEGLPGLSRIFGDIPAPQSRVRLLDEALNAGLLQALAAGLTARVAHCQALGWQDAAWVANLLPKCYQDDYLKKAQLALMLIAGQFRQLGMRVSLDVSAAADYQLPKVLRRLGILVYGEQLAQLVDQGYLLVEDVRYERAIRAATIYAVSAIAEHFNTGVEQVDFWLWTQRNDGAPSNFHLCLTTNY